MVRPFQRDGGKYADKRTEIRCDIAYRYTRRKNCKSRRGLGYGICAVIQPQFIA